MFGTANVDFATFEYLRSPASAFLLAWHSLFFLGDPLDAAMPALIMVAALFGTVTVHFVRSLFGLSWRAAMAVAAIAVCAPMFRWALATYSLGELLSATSVLYLVGVVCRGVAARSLYGSMLLGIGAGGTLLFFSARSAVGSPAALHAALSKRFTTFRRWPCSACRADYRRRQAPDVLRLAALVVIPFVLVRGPRQCGHFAGRRCWIGSARLPIASLPSALVIYMAAGVIIGNVAVQAVSVSRPARWPGGGGS